MRTFVLSAPGRDAITWATVANLRHQNPGEAFSVYCSPGRGGVTDFWALLRTAAAARDRALLLEDDIVTARNFIRFAADWRAPYVTSFFCMRGGVELGKPEDPRAFGYAQALWVPASLLGRLAATSPPMSSRLQDDALGSVLAEMGESIIYHRSLVQHTGLLSLCRPGRALPVAPDFVGEAFDCLALPNWI